METTVDAEIERLIERRAALVVGVAVSATPAGLIWAWYAPTLHYPGEGIR